MSSPSTLPRRIVLVENTKGGSAVARRRRAHAALAREGLTIAETVPVNRLDRLTGWVQSSSDQRPMIVAAGGDGTIGAVVDHVVNTNAVFGILPLGTSNDVARSLKIPMRIENAVRLLKHGKVSTVDVGVFVGQDGHTDFFMHAAAVGLNVAFAKLATQASFRKRLGRLAYGLAGVIAMRRREPFDCELRIDGDSPRLRLLHLSVINAPVFGGFFRLRIAGSDVDDRRLDVVAIENMPLHRLAITGFRLLLGGATRLRGVRTMHVRRLRVHSDRPLAVSLDGEISAQIPGDFILAAEALRVVTPLHFVDVDD